MHTNIKTYATAFLLAAMGFGAVALLQDVKANTSWCWCTDYIANRLGFTTYGDAYTWDNGLLPQNGYEKVAPAVGTVVIMELGYPDFPNGHVGIVTSYEPSTGYIHVRGAAQSGGWDFSGNEFGCNNVSTTTNNVNVHNRSDISFWAKPVISGAPTANLNLLPKSGHPSIRPVYRFYNTLQGYSRLTTSDALKNSLAADPTWLLEGLAFYAEQNASTGLVQIKYARNYQKGEFYGTAQEVASLDSTWTKTNTTVFSASLNPLPGRTPVYRMYNPSNGKYLHTSDLAESNYLAQNGWTSQIAFYAHSNDGCHNDICAMYRLYNSVENTHYYTTDIKQELTPTIVSDVNWKHKGVPFFVYQSAGINRVPYYRQYNPVLKSFYFSTSNASLGVNWSTPALAFYAPLSMPTHNGTIVREYYNQSNGRYTYDKEAPEAGWVSTGKTFYGSLTF